MNYHNIKHDDMNNGDGLRVTLFVSGCTHCCKGCQNPETWDALSGVPFDNAAKQEILGQLNQTYISGITLSGGDPLNPLNRNTLTQLCKEIKEKYPTKTIWCYTGFLYEEVKSLEIMKYIDVLVDGEFKIDLLDNSLHWVGSSNQKIYKLQDGEIVGTIPLK